MLEILCQFDVPFVEDKATLAPLIDLLIALPGFSEARYDLNQHESWRAFDREKLLVDALNKRIELVRVANEDASQIAMLSSGSPHTPPMCMWTLALDEREMIPTVLPLLRAHLKRARALAWCALTSPTWRAQIASMTTLSSLPPGVPPIAMILVAPDDLEVELIEREPLNDDLFLWPIAPHGVIENARHGEAISALYRAMRT